MRDGLVELAARAEATQNKRRARLVATVTRHYAEVREISRRVGIDPLLPGAWTLKPNAFLRWSVLDFGAARPGIGNRALSEIQRPAEELPWRYVELLAIERGLREFRRGLRGIFRNEILSERGFASYRFNS